MNNTLGGQQLVDLNLGRQICMDIVGVGLWSYGDSNPVTPHCQCENACAAACHRVYGVSDNACLQPVLVLMCLGRACG